MAKNKSNDEIHCTLIPSPMASLHPFYAILFFFFSLCPCDNNIHSGRTTLMAIGSRVIMSGRIEEQKAFKSAQRCDVRDTTVPLNWIEKKNPQKSPDLVIFPHRITSHPHPTHPSGILEAKETHATFFFSLSLFVVCTHYTSGRGRTKGHRPCPQGKPIPCPLFQLAHRVSIVSSYLRETDEHVVMAPIGQQQAILFFFANSTHARFIIAIRL